MQSIQQQRFDFSRWGLLAYLHSLYGTNDPPVSHVWKIDIACSPRLHLHQALALSCVRSRACRRCGLGRRNAGTAGGCTAGFVLLVVCLLCWDLSALLMMNPSARMRPSLALVPNCRWETGDGGESGAELELSPAAVAGVTSANPSPVKRVHQTGSGFVLNGVTPPELRQPPCTSAKYSEVFWVVAICVWMCSKTTLSRRKGFLISTPRDLRNPSVCVAPLLQEASRSKVSTTRRCATYIAL